ncbi:hypothetical protein [Fodinibius sp. SL11]|uniref:hypothetical protein n=1 Tax=Fodinibius sp. SL11 TaxID=3425690 RepID=UPI003F8829DE
MRKHLVDLLFEEFKQMRFFRKLEEQGITFRDFRQINNWDIVCDIIGIPEDNTLEYDFDYINSGGEVRDESKKKPDDNMFCRDKYFGHYIETIDEVSEEQNIIATDNGLKVENEIDEEKIKKALGKHVDWLYKEAEDLNNN